MSYVMDASVAMAWCLDDESTPETDALLDELASTEGYVPALWRYEVANVIRIAVRRSRIDARREWEILDVLDHLPLWPIEPPDVEHLARISAEHALTPYDASYLDLAKRRGLPLATLDARLREAATKAGVEVLP